MFNDNQVNNTICQIAIRRPVIRVRGIVFENVGFPKYGFVDAWKMLLCIVQQFDVVMLNNKHV